jgi:hypothetical protein
LVTDHHATPGAERGQASGHRAIIAKQSVPAKFDEIGEGELEVVERVGPRRMSGNLHALPSREV